MRHDHHNLEQTPVHVSLQRRPRLGGLPQDAFLLIALIMVSMAIASRLAPLVLVGCAVVYLALLPLLRRLFEKEPFLMEIIPRALRYEARYSRQAKERRAYWCDRVSTNVHR